MRRTRARVGVALVVSAITTVGLGTVPTPASAQPTGLTFYSGSFSTEVATLPAPTGACEPLPATADSHIGWSGFENVIFYRTEDCTGQATGVGTLRTYPAGGWLSFLAY